VADQPVQDMVQQAEQVAATAEAEAQPVQPQPKYGYFWGTGRRKSAVARVRIRPGDGKFEINGRSIEEYFTEERDRKGVLTPLVVTEQVGKWDVFVNVRGGGYTGQAGAIILGLARALCEANPDLSRALRDHGLLRRDPREKERKKYGRRGARRGFQFSKR